MSACLSSTSFNNMNRLLIRAVLLESLGICVAQQVPLMLAPPTQVRFDSVDYRNILRWTPPNASVPLQYFVQWKIYGELEWLDVEGCQGILKHHCDLSSVTPDLREWYYARVHAFFLPSSKSAWALSPRFSPRFDTKINPPILKLNVTEQGIVVRLKPSKALIRKLQNKLHHKIYVTRTGGEEEVFEMECCLNKLTLRELQHKETYCLQAQTTIPHQAKSSTRGTLKCVTAV
ncbi:interleukin-22 receptor subunit alpha-2 [Halichoeres trimaculatus]|uniref:interleukin-22 receptor subunit alpha-2 n=1 Tax=Halichoeres trimaculatus TaxID=147232 RepID=UPI003D9EEABD